MRQSKRSWVRGGFTYIDLLVVICLVVVLSAAVLPAAVGSREVANRVKCAANLKQIGMAIMLYANENRDAMPRTRYDMEKADKPTAFTNAKAVNPFKDDGPEANDVSAALFLLLRTEDLVADVFVCPADGKKPLHFANFQKIQSVSNFPDASRLSYSLRNPYPSKDAVGAGYKAMVIPDEKVVLAADGNPGVKDLLDAKAKSSAEDLEKVNSFNHGQKGQNVLFMDGRVEWMTTPFCGVDKDNIYTYGPSGDDQGGTGIVGSPTTAKDCVLLPVLEEMKKK
jgi:type II secretory pathway pseudopilin PulG